MILAHKIQLDPNNKQATYFAKACGTARFAYNWALAEWKRQYEAGEKTNEAKLRRELNAIKRKDYPWMPEVTKCAPQLAIKDLGKAFNNFFAKRAEFPTFKKKGKKDSFGLSNDQFAMGVPTYSCAKNQAEIACKTCSSHKPLSSLALKDKTYCAPLTLHLMPARFKR